MNIIIFSVGPLLRFKRRMFFFYCVDGKISLFSSPVEDRGNHFNVPYWSQASSNNPSAGCSPEATRLASHLCNEQGTVIPPYSSSKQCHCDFTLSKIVWTASLQGSHSFTIKCNWPFYVKFQRPKSGIV